jgi:hypothetical protein
MPLYTSRYVDDGNDDAYSDGGSERTTNTDDGDSERAYPANVRRSSGSSSRGFDAAARAGSFSGGGGGGGGSSGGRGSRGGGGGGGGGGGAGAAVQDESQPDSAVAMGAGKRKRSRPRKPEVKMTKEEMEAKYGPRAIMCTCGRVFANGQALGGHRGKCKASFFFFLFLLLSLLLFISILLPSCLWLFLRSFWSHVFHLYGRFFHLGSAKIVFTTGLNFELLIYYLSTLSHRFAKRSFFLPVKATFSFLFSYTLFLLFFVSILFLFWHLGSARAGKGHGRGARDGWESSW